MLRNTIAGIKELMELKIVASVDRVPTASQFADCMTKKGKEKKADWLLNADRNNSLSRV